ncbi:MAG: hypothetical protein AB1606_07475 [Nitrospirota bacterium]
MEICKGLEDWLACARCPYLCTRDCPLEGDNVMEELRQKIRLLKSTVNSFKGAEGSRPFDKR